MSAVMKKKPYGWNKAVQMLKAAQILDTGVGENASEIMQSLSERYAVEQYSFAWKVFWLITGYMPPRCLIGNPISEEKVC